MKNEKNFAWPNDCQGAISLTFDDGMSSQLEIAIPLLNKYGLFGTFYINPAGDDWKKRYVPWHEAANRGHEIGNHSLCHFGSYNYFPDLGYYNSSNTILENSKLEEVEADILEAQRRLETLFPEQKKWTYCYPNGQTFVGRGEKRQSYVPIVARHFIAARDVSELGWSNLPLYCDLYDLFASDVHLMRGFEMIGLIERAVAEGRWGIILIHGIQQGHLPISDVYFEELLAHLDRNRNRIWTAPVVKVAEYVLEWRAKI